jgi:hypothetical protein
VLSLTQCAAFDAMRCTDAMSTSTQVRLEFRQEQEGWDWAAVSAEELAAEWTPHSAKLTIDSAK